MRGAGDAHSPFFARGAALPEGARRSRSIDSSISLPRRGEDAPDDVRGIAQRRGEDEVELARVALDDDDAAAAPHRGWTRRARGSVCLSVGDDATRRRR